MAKPLTEYLELKDIQIAYTQSGSGQVLLLLHGNSESKGIFKDYQAKHFSMFQTIALDSRGHGESKSGDEEYTIKQISQDVIDFCKAKGITEAYVIGYSDGGNIALFLASEAPALFPRLIAISPNYLLSGTTDSGLRMITILHGVMKVLSHIGFKVRKSMLRLNLMLTDIGITDAELNGVRTNLKIIYAEHDLIKEEHLQQLVSLVPNATLDKIPGCNHVSILHNQKAIDSMKNFLLAHE